MTGSYRDSQFHTFYFQLFHEVHYEQRYNDSRENLLIGGLPEEATMNEVIIKGSENGPGEKSKERVEKEYAINVFCRERLLKV